ncbi:MAG: c-type cytochrome [Helicobacteraceae bacterium]|jgi:ubiquinol-cytochrome c reductase cytochrome c1 subunit|nr:c-type cytochrome [Helicobacteraceae bacterium]
MKNLKILLVLVVFTGFTYWGIEPLAHSVFNPYVSPVDYDFTEIFTPDGAKPDKNAAKAERARIMGLIAGGDAADGEAQFNVCMGCHTLQAATPPHTLDPKMLVESYGLVPPDLSYATLIYDEPFLFKYIMNPNHAAYKAAHTELQKELSEKEKKSRPKEAAKIDETTAKSIIDFDEKIDMQLSLMIGFIADEESAANLMAYLREVAATKGGKPTYKELVLNACARCHSVKYDKIDVKADVAKLKTYLGSVPPDLSVMIKSKGKDYLSTFVNEPQKHLLGTTMPRVGLTEESQEKVIAYLERVGDPKKDDRALLGVFFVGYFLLMAAIAYAWKHNEFEEMEDDDS